MHLASLHPHPVYNEEESMSPLLDRVLGAPLPAGLERELIVADDCPTDGSAEIAEAAGERARRLKVVGRFRPASGSSSGCSTRTD